MQAKQVINWRGVYEANSFDKNVFEQIQRGEIPDCLQGQGKEAEFFMEAVRLIANESRDMTNAEFSEFQLRFDRVLSMSQEQAIEVDNPILTRADREQVFSACIVDAIADDGSIPLESVIEGLEREGFDVSELRAFCEEIISREGVAPNA
ncbi:hypothetical protein [Cohnella herbarum]|uniref:Uncharacterized protein n=1 Tax=Cohnella herbarum TaxID=2728023 RepID=A0A7Z2ZPV6_9BACL|nr:hypothetical protein [Cohnella herbarum]QJD87589.1 hypothetical protein HH215_33350 [Cohnella herbarum]